MTKIVYEDNHLLIVEKKANIPVQKDSSCDMDLQTILKKYLKEKYNKPGNVYLGIVHRLDRPVGGIMVFAKTSKAASRLSKQIQNHEVEKKYIAVVSGKTKKEDFMEDYLLKNEKDNTVSISPKGKYASLRYKKLDFKNNLSFVDINLKTGRSHQIRVQFASRGYPLYADRKYNKRKQKENIALFAYQITFYHPITKEKMTFTLPYPKRYPFTLFLKNNK